MVEGSESGEVVSVSCLIQGRAYEVVARRKSSIQKLMTFIYVKIKIIDSLGSDIIKEVYITSDVECKLLWKIILLEALLLIKSCKI